MKQPPLFEGVPTAEELKNSQEGSASMVRPKTRSDCRNGPRPCPWTSCRLHLASFSSASSQETCALDVADRGAHTLEELGIILGYTRERIRQFENGAQENFRLTWELLERYPKDADEMALKFIKEESQTSPKPSIPEELMTRVEATMTGASVSRQKQREP